MKINNLITEATKALELLREQQPSYEVFNYQIKMQKALDYAYNVLVLNDSDYLVEVKTRMAQEIQKHYTKRS